MGELSGFCRSLSLDLSTIICRKTISLSEAEALLKRQNPADMAMQQFTPRRKHQMNKQIELWKNQPLHDTLPWNVVNRYYLNVAYVPALYYSYLVGIYINQQISDALQRHETLSEQDPKGIEEAIFNFLNDMMQLGNTIRKLAYRSIPESIKGTYQQDKMETILRDMPDEHLFIVSLFLIGLSFTTEAIAAYANFVQLSPNLITEHTNLPTYVANLMRSELSDVARSRITIAPKNTNVEKRRAAERKKAESLRRIRLFVEPLRLNDSLNEYWDNILSNPTSVAELTTYRHSRLNRELGFNVNKLFTYITPLYAQHKLPYKSKRQLLQALQPPHIVIPASYMNEK